MRVETDVDILLGCAIGLIIAWLFDYKFKSVAIARVLLAMMLAFTMPAWLPGHGEIVLLLPSVALFLVVSTTANIAGIIFVLLNAAIVWFILRKFFKQ